MFFFKEDDCFHHKFGITIITLEYYIKYLLFILVTEWSPYFHSESVSGQEWKKDSSVTNLDTFGSAFFYILELLKWKMSKKLHDFRFKKELEPHFSQSRIHTIRHADLQ